MALIFSNPGLQTSGLISRQTDRYASVPVKQDYTAKWGHLPDCLTVDEIPTTALGLNQMLDHTNESQSLRRFVEINGRESVISYDDCALEFNRAFFLRNFLKCFIALTRFSGFSSNSIDTTIDVGGGIGTFSLAARSFYPFAMNQVVDKSKSQINLGKNLDSNLNLSHVDEWIRSDAFELRANRSDLKLFSYVACENQKMSINGIVDEALLSASACIFVDYPDMIESVIERATTRDYTGNVFLRHRVDLCPELARLVGQSFIEVSGGYIVRRPPDR